MRNSVLSSDFRDTYQVYQNPSLLVRKHYAPAEYQPVQKKTISEEELMDPETHKLDPERVIPHVRDFVVEYINSDVLV